MIVGKHRWRKKRGFLVKPDMLVRIGLLCEPEIQPASGGGKVGVEEYRGGGNTQTVLLKA